MSQSIGSPAVLRATVNLTKTEIAHLWSGGTLSLKVEGRAARNIGTQDNGLLRSRKCA